MFDVSFSIEPYEFIKKDLIAFRNANRDLMRDEAYFRWRYKERPNGADPIIVWAKDNSGARVGALSVIPHHYQLGNHTTLLGVLGDISILEQQRGKGIARRMFNFLAESNESKKFAALIVLPNDEAARAFQGAGWQTITKIERHIKFLSIRRTLDRHIGSFLSGLLSPVSDSLLKLLSLETLLSSNKDCKGELLDCFDDRFDELWQAVDKKGTFLALRNKAYLTWRYSNHPIVNYHIFALSYRTGLSGYIVFHLHNDICYIDDILFRNDRKTRNQLFFCFIQHVRSHMNLTAIIINVNENNFLKHTLGQFGFIRRPDHLKVMARCIHAEYIEDLFKEGRNWFLTAGDKDT